MTIHEYRNARRDAARDIMAEELRTKRMAIMRLLNTPLVILPDNYQSEANKALDAILG